MGFSKKTARKLLHRAVMIKCYAFEARVRHIRIACARINRGMHTSHRTHKYADSNDQTQKRFHLVAISHISSCVYSLGSATLGKTPIRLRFMVCLDLLLDSVGLQKLRQLALQISVVTSGQKTTYSRLLFIQC
ncbi:MAG: hypothetical protein U0L60_02760, partial [Ruminococcus sp.]|nr:hypothetical protein [Ruminococcus sp.]